MENSNTNLYWDLKLAFTALKGTSINNSVQIVYLNQAKTAKDMLDLKCPSKHTTIQSLCELLQCFKIHLASPLSESEEIALVLDSTTDSNREVLAVFFASKSEKEGIWSHPYGVIETRGHTAEL